ncbi:peptidyl-prolyl cis-trans isomerase A-like 4E [Eurosta solidaginis]|uniref:peptidyl-prolyl cis-trans isomerase A-like 4E n=1 Tax=Eurosta solidaginis TaxID=178769 RepID=UPI003531153A
MISDKMRTQMYRDHRQRLRHIQCRVNCGTYRTFNRTKGNNCTYSESSGSVKSKFKPQSNPNIRFTQLQPQFEKRNVQLCERGLVTKSMQDTRQIMRSKGSSDSEPPQVYKGQTVQMPYPSIALKLRSLRPVGRVLIQLYTEASPQVVLEFMRIAKNCIADNLLITRVFPSLWLEGELCLAPDSHTHREHEFDTRSLNHTNHGGIVSYSRESVNGIDGNRLSFSISFRPLPAANSKRVAFGRIVGGLKFLYELQDYGTKNGKPTRKIVVSKCGLFSKNLPSRRY